MKEKLEKFDKLIDRMTKATAILGGVLSIVMVVFLCASVFAQRVLHNPITGAYEVCQYVLMPIATLPAFAYAYHAGLLPKFELVKAKNPVWNWFCLIANAAVEILVFAIMTYGAFRFALKGWESKASTYAGSNWFPIYPYYWFLVIAFLPLEITVIYTHIRKVYDYVAGNKKKEETNPIEEGEENSHE